LAISASSKLRRCRVPLIEVMSGVQWRSPRPREAPPRTDTSCRTFRSPSSAIDPSLRSELVNDSHSDVLPSPSLPYPLTLRSVAQRSVSKGGNTAFAGKCRIAAALHHVLRVATLRDAPLRYTPQSL
jgi:hypothetical protein